MAASTYSPVRGSQVGRLSAFSYGIYFKQNDFTGSIPSEFGALLQLSSALLLGENSFSGSIPRCAVI